MHIQKIHQFSFACSSGDGVTNSLFYIRRLLRLMGFESEIYSETIPADLQHEVRPLPALQDDAGTLLLSHHCLGYDHWQWLIESKLPKVMVYHNITPIDLLPSDGDIRRWAQLGRQQLKEWAPHFLGAIGVSELNSEELEDNHYRNVSTIPLLIDFDRMTQVEPDASIMSSYKDSYNILFVGRVCENKCQLELVEVLHHLCARRSTPFRLILAGAITSEDYRQKILQRAQELGVSDRLVITGKVSEQALLGLYRGADVFACVSAHEGFGMPLIEAMRYGLPVMARESSNIGNTLGEAGILLPANVSMWDFAQHIWTLSQEPQLRRKIIATQLQRLQRFETQRVLHEFAAYLERIGIPLKAPLAPQTSTIGAPEWQVEGPFDSHYSLAIVNREVARGLVENGEQVRLRSHEGHGDFEPHLEVFDEQPDLRLWFEKARSSQMPPDVALRFCYPPHADDMPARVRAVHSYGWEETGFPYHLAQEFNRRLDLITVLSKDVKKILRDSGVRIPIAVTGAGLDHVARGTTAVDARRNPEGWRSFRFLHVSSCFPRKGVDVLLQAYGKAFSCDDDVSLIIKSFANVHNEVQKQLQQCRQHNPQFPHVEVILEDWDQQQMRELYQSVDAFVAPSRGEGFGLPVAEAMLFEVPVITTGWGGQTDFCDEEVAWMCDFAFAKAQTHLGLNHSLWAEPDHQHLAQLLRAVYAASPGERANKTRLAKQRVEKMSWQRCTEKIRTAVHALERQAWSRDKPTIAWLSTWNSKCGIASYSNYLTQVFPENRLLVLANHVEDPMDRDQDYVQRCWRASDQEELEQAMQLIDELDLQVVVIQYNFGFFSLATLAKVLLALQQQGKTSYVFLHSTADVDLPEVKKSLSAILPALKTVSRIFVHGVDDVNRLKQWGLVDNVCFFPHGVSVPDPQLIQASKAAPMAASMAALEPEPSALAPKRKIVIASYGFLLPHKGIPELIEAFSLLDHDQHAYQLLLVNALYPVSVSHHLRASCEAQITHLGLYDKVQMVNDYLSDFEAQQQLSQADLIVFPYQNTQESSSAAVRVGLATGRPVAVTPLPIFSDVNSAVNLLPGLTPQEIARGIQTLVHDQASLDAQMQAARRWIDEHDWRRLSQRLLDLIDGEAEQKCWDKGLC